MVLRGVRSVRPRIGSRGRVGSGCTSLETNAHGWPSALLETWERGRHWFASQAPAIRIGLVALVLALPSTLLVWAWRSEETPTRMVPVPGFRIPSHAQVELILDDLWSEQIRAVLHSSGEVLVPESKVREAKTQLARRRWLIPRPEEIPDLFEATSMAWLESHRDAQARRRLKKEMLLAANLFHEGGIANLVWIRVNIIEDDRPRSLTEPRLVVDVHVEMRDDARLNVEAQNRIVRQLQTYLPGLGDDAISLHDRHREYRRLGESEPVAEQVERHRLDDLQAKIVGRLRKKIDDVRVVVELADPASTGLDGDLKEGARPDGKVTTVINQFPMSIESVPGDEATRSRRDETAARVPSAMEVERQPVLVQVHVPMSYYRRTWRQENEGRDPKEGELGTYINLIRTRIEREVVSVAMELGDEANIPLIQIIPFQDLPEVQPSVEPSEAIASSSDLRWIALILIMGVLIVITNLSTHTWHSRRRSARPHLRGDRAHPPGGPTRRRDSPSSSTPHAHGSSAVSAGYVDQARELVRLDPDVASGILQRWIRDGGTNE